MFLSDHPAPLVYSIADHLICSKLPFIEYDRRVMNIMNPRLNTFIRTCDQLGQSGCDAGSCVSAAAPLMLELAGMGSDLIADDQKRVDTQMYARNAIHLGDADGVSLFALVWLPGQWTPIHDHGTWGVVGILEGVL